MSNKHRLTWYRWEWADPYKKDRWTACTVSVYEPTYDMPFVSILISIANGGGKVLMRCSTLEEARHRIGIPEEGIERLELAYTTAESTLIKVKRDLRLIYDSHALQPGEKLVNTGTGEVIAEAERILHEH